jgi:hypothetical protein
MVYAYRLAKKNDQGRVIEGFGIRRTWQYTSDEKVEILSKWSQVVLLKANDIKALKTLIGEFEKNDKGRPAGESSPVQDPAPISDVPEGLKEKLEGMNLPELKQFAKDKGLPESEYSGFTRTKLIEYLLLALSEKN